jgi:hypothetical protein
VQAGAGFGDHPAVGGGIELAGEELVDIEREELDAMRIDATDALCGGTPAAVRISSENRVSAAAEIRGIEFQRSVWLEVRASSRRRARRVYLGTTTGTVGLRHS